MTKQEFETLTGLHKQKKEDAPAVYVGTYAKYNSGSLYGAWLDLTTFANEDDFINFCKNVLHADEDDPELMAQEWDNVPESLCSECPDWSRVFEWLALDEDERNIVGAYLDGVYGTEYDFQKILDSHVYTGDFQDYADNVAAEFLYGVEETVINYFDYEAFARDLRHDYHVCEYDGETYVFVAD